MGCHAAQTTFATAVQTLSRGHGRPGTSHPRRARWYRMNTAGSAAGCAPGTATGRVAVTVVVSTRNRRHKIEICARTLVALRCRLPWQCVIVDNGSSDGTLERLRELATALAPGLEVVS
jgi:hypothetical protein